MTTDNRLKIFVAVAQSGSFTLAARSLGCTQPAVSQNIAELEKQLGTQLMERSRGEITLTEDGERFLGFARQIQHWYQVAHKAFHPNPLELHPQSQKPSSVKLEDGREVKVWASGNDLHIEIPKD